MMLLAFLTGCDAWDRWWVDAGELDVDGDGVDASSDCDDGDPRKKTKPTWYRDHDGDGFGDVGDTTEACSQPDGYVAKAGDCNDLATVVNPTASEQCDRNHSVDENCNELIDNEEIDTGYAVLDANMTCYYDGDADGVGDTSNGRALCACDSEWVATLEDDCDDTNAIVSPNAPEICHTDVNEDCDEEVEAHCTIELGHLSNRWEGPFDDDLPHDERPQVGYQVAWAGDLNADGRDDVLIGAPGVGGLTDPAGNSGAVYILYGRGEDAVTARLEAPDGFIRGDRRLDSSPAGWFGKRVIAGRFVDGDLTPDIAVGAANGGGAVFVFSGVACGSGQCDASGAAVIIDGYGVASLGESLAAGDFDDDAADDELLVGAPGEDRVYLLDVGDEPSGSLLDPPGTYVEGGGKTGFAVAAIDVIGDGTSSILVAAPEAVCFNGLNPGLGKVYLFPDRTAFDEGHSMEGADAHFCGADGDKAGYSLAGADVNGDGYDEVLVGAPYRDGSFSYAGGAYVLSRKEEDGQLEMFARLDGAAAYDWAGTAVAGAGDIDADGKADVVIGAAAPDGESVYGYSRVYVLSGINLEYGSTFDLSDAAWTLNGELPRGNWYDFTGASVAGGGFYDDDEKPDLLVGAPGRDDVADPTILDRGMVYLIPGSELPP